MTNILFIPILLYLCLVGVIAGEDATHVPRDVFDSLEELSRLVDISYCVGTTGVRQPFQCLSRCDDFPDFELITVCYPAIPPPRPAANMHQTRPGTRESSYLTHADISHSHIVPSESSLHSGVPIP